MPHLLNDFTNLDKNFILIKDILGPQKNKINRFNVHPDI